MDTEFKFCLRKVLARRGFFLSSFYLINRYYESVNKNLNHYTDFNCVFVRTSTVCSRNNNYKYSCISLDLFTALKKKYCLYLSTFSFSFFMSCRGYFCCKNQQSSPFIDGSHLSGFPVHYSSHWLNPKEKSSNREMQKV